MKKNLVRIVAFVLVAILALALLPLGALAVDTTVDQFVFDKNDPTLMTTPKYYLGSDNYADGTTIQFSKYDKLYTDINGDLYDFRGFASLENINKAVEKIWANDKLTVDEKDAAVMKLVKNTTLNFQNKDLKIDKFPTSGKYEDEMKWFQKWGYIIAGYAPHQHRLSRWISDGTTHWRNCLVCGEDFVYQNWCEDGDEDGVCNVCGGHVPYHDIIVQDSEGGKITVNRETASHRTKITADVQANDGYQLKKVHFVKVRTDGSKQEITCYQDGVQRWTPMPTYDLEVSAEFVKQ